MTLRFRRTHAAPGSWDPPRISEVRAGSPCSEDVRAGDFLLALDGKPPLDVLDYLEAAGKSRVSLRLSRDGKVLRRRVRKESGVPLGLVFEETVFDGVRTCRNHCVFCFVDQMPPGFRETLYIKDDDYRLSFYYGNFITLNNISRDDMERIKRLRLSPLYVSLHSTDAALRSRLMGGNGSRGLEVLRELLAAGIEIHLQVVVCPGLNDGEALRRTLRDVLYAYPAASLGMVPLGLTSCAASSERKLAAHDRASALRVLEAVDEHQALAMRRYGRRVFFAADEFYLMAEADLPASHAYEGYPQLENGVGMARKLMQEACEEAAAGRRGSEPARGVVTGVAGGMVIRETLKLCGIAGAEVIDVENQTLGKSVTVSALLGGADIIKSLRETEPSPRELLIPASMLWEGSFIDGRTPACVERETGYRLLPVEVDGARLVREIYGEGSQD